MVISETKWFPNPTLVFQFELKFTFFQFWAIIRMRVQKKPSGFFLGVFQLQKQIVYSV